MMKKVLLYAVTAVLLGTLTMIAPLMLMAPPVLLPFARWGESTLGVAEGTFEEEGALERAVSPSNLSSAGLMLIPSFLLALGVSLYFKKRML